MSKRKQDDFLELYKVVHNDFERFCRARAYHDMPYEDLMNETLFIAYQKLDQLEKRTSFLSFLIGISLRVLANSRRKKRAIATNFEEHHHQNYIVEQDDFTRFSDVELLHFALSQLPKQQREAIILFEITGFSIREIMEIQSSGKSAVKQRLARGRKELAKILIAIENKAAI
ncbi:MAG: RNA polymerase sigma factor [Bacteroidota bacterium]